MLELLLAYLPTLLQAASMLAVGLFGINFSKSKGSSQSQQVSGFDPKERLIASPTLLDWGLNLGRESQQAYQSPFGFFQGQTRDQLAPVNQYGLPMETQPAVESMIRQSTNQFSAANAARGQFAPENIAGISGSAISAILPQLIPQIMGYSQFRTMLPEQLQAQRLGFLAEPIRTMSPLLGTQATASSGYSGFGFGGQLGGGGSEGTLLQSLFG